MESFSRCRASEDGAASRLWAAAVRGNARKAMPKRSTLHLPVLDQSSISFDRGLIGVLYGALASLQGAKMKFTSERLRLSALQKLKTMGSIWSFQGPRPFRIGTCATVRETHRQSRKYPIARMRRGREEE